MPYWRLFYHIVWATKNREPIIDQEWEDSLYKVMATKAKSLEATVHIIGGIEDHVHVVVSVPPRIALTSFIGQLKGSSSHFVNHSLTLSHEFGWQAEYGVVTFGHKQLQWVIQYVRNQRAHHQKSEVVPLLEQFQ
ncbi:MAG: IS200/IS605 family transposase [Ardenticatenales bacterium]|nr:IS200/IS605 family transposase [Ardenticatenales bacterium]